MSKRVDVEAVVELPDGEGGVKTFQLVGADTAPIVAFDLAPTYNTPNGAVHVTLIALTNYPTQGGGGELLGRTTGILRTTPQGAAFLIDTLQKALLSLAPAANPDGPKN